MFWSKQGCRESYLKKILGTSIMLHCVWYTSGHPLHVSVFSTIDGCDRVRNDGWGEKEANTSSVTFSIYAKQYNCDNCWDTCDETFEVGDLQGKNVHGIGLKSIYIPEGYVARTYLECNADYLYEFPQYVSTLRSGCNVIDGSSSFFFHKEKETTAVFSEPNCMETSINVGHMSLATFSIEVEQFNCHNCWDSCLEKFDDGTPTHGDKGSLVESIYVPVGYVARAYSDCLADFNYETINFVTEFESGCSNVPKGVSTFRFEKKRSTAIVYNTNDGCEKQVDEATNPFQLSVSTSYKQFYCESCFDSCDEYFINGSPTQDEVKSIYIPDGWWAKAFQNCNSDHEYSDPGYVGILKSGCHVLNGIQSFQFVEPQNLVTVYNTIDGCQEGFDSPDAKLSFPTSIESKSCHDCWDSCGETFEDGSEVHTAYGSRVRSIYIPPGYMVKTYGTCNADFQISRGKQRYKATLGSGCHALDWTTSSFHFFPMV